jgi:flagellar hook-associated protein 1 FlgK
MSSLIANLLRGTAALTAQSKGLEVTGRNLANVNTAGYSRQRVELGAGETMVGRNGPEAMEVRIEGVTQARDIFLDRQVMSERTLLGALETTQDAYQQVQTALGQDIDTGGQASGVDAIADSTKGIAGGLDEFFGAFNQLSVNPANPAARSTVIGSAAALADKINSADQRLATVQSTLTEKINLDVDAVNGLLSEIATLNQKITRYEVNSPGGALDLRDQRQSKLEELSKYMSFETRPDLSVGGQLQIIARDDVGGEVTLVNRYGASPISFNGSSFSSGSPVATLALASGSLPAALSARDGFTQSVRDDLARFADQLRNAVNTAYNPGGTGPDFFAAPVGSGLIGLAPGLTESTLSATASGDAGANEIALAVAAVGTKAFSSGGGDSIDGTLAGFFGATVTRVGAALQRTGSDLEDQQLTTQLAASRRDQVSGVSLDEETANLMKYQRAFQASARFVSVIDEMLNVVVNQMGKI